MTGSRSSATSDLMALICLIGGAVRGAGESNLLMQLLVIGAMVRPVGQALEAWLLVEELYADREFHESSRDDEDGWEGEDELRAGWVGKGGRVVQWRHVTRFGLAVLIPIQWGGMVRKPEPAVARRGWSVVGMLVELSGFRIFCWVWLQRLGTSKMLRIRNEKLAAGVGMACHAG